MSGFLSTLVDSFANQGNNTSNDQQQQQQQQQPQVPYPWIARWDDGENRYIYINEQTGERSMTPPDNEMQQSWDGDRSRLEQSASDFPSDAAQWTGRRVGEAEQIPDNVEAGVDRFGDGVERRFDDAVNDVQEAPEDFEQGFDRFGDDAERKFDDAVDDVQDAPENVAGWMGDKVGGVERFGDEVQGYGDGLGDAYDQGRDEGRRDEDY